MTHDKRLQLELEHVSRRFRSLALWLGFGACWLIIALGGAVVLLLARTGERWVPGFVLVAFIVLVPVLAWIFLAARLRRMRDPVWIAHQVERRFPELDTRLLAALEQQSQESDKTLGFLQQTVIGEALQHARRTGWERVVAPRTLTLAKWGHNVALLLVAAVLVGFMIDISRRPSGTNWWTGGGAGDSKLVTIKVEPEDASIERGTSLLVLARFPQGLPNGVQLVYRDEKGQLQQMPMSRSLDDPLFAARIASVNQNLNYAVRYDDAQTKWFKVSVFDYPELRQADARLKFPQYTNLGEKLVEDMRSVTAVEGTKATLTFHLNKPVAKAHLVPTSQPANAMADSPPPVELQPDAKDPAAYSIAFDLTQSQSYRLHLVDEQNRANKQPPEIVLNITANRPPELKLEFPGRDVDVSPLEELSLKAKVSDDFGVHRVGVSYAMAGQAAKDIVLAERVPANQQRDVGYLVAMEKLEAKPDQLLSYHFWAEDFGADGKVRRTAGDMFFAEVRPFEEIFRQGQQPSADQQQQQQQQGGQNAQQAEELAELQKQIIAATWKVMRREIASPVSAQFTQDVKLIGESQSSAKEQAEALGERLRDDRSRTFLQSVIKNMERAVSQLNKATEGATAEPLASALSSEQAAYQDLLRLRAREHEVVRSNRRQQQQQQGGNSSAGARRQRQLDQLELAEEENRYASERTAPREQQQQDPAQRETRQVLNRLRELAQRQEDLNRQMRELQAQLAEAKQEAQREELKRQLARLRDQQQQVLRDTDELRDRMDQPENQQRMADSRQQLEETRSDVRRASEALQQGMVPEAASAGARAAEQLNNLREQVRSAAAGQFTEAMDQMRQDARQLDQNQQDLSKRLADLDEQRKAQLEQQPRTLRDTGERKQVAQDLARQKEELEKLLQDVRRTVEEAETAEPLLSRQLYDAARELSQNRTDQALDASQQLLERGFMEEARKVETEAGRGITRLREGVEKAAESVLGDEAEALRRARNELDQLSQELDREMMRRSGNGGLGASTRPGQSPLADARGATTRAARAGSAATRPGGAGARQAGTRPSGAASDADQRGSATTRPDGAVAQAAGATTRPGAGQARREADAPAESGQSARNQQQQTSEDGNSRQPQQQARTGSSQAQSGQQRQQNQSGQGSPGGQQQQQQDAQQADSQNPGAGQRPSNADARRGGSAGLRDQTARSAPEDDLRRLLEETGRRDGGRGGGGTGPIDDPDQRLGPLTGENFREWSDRLRDVEEMVGDPRLRAEAARVRERARAMRADFDRHSKEPNWDLVREFVGRPLLELRDKVSEELLRRNKAEALVPIDREPVPSEYAEQVRQYYERLGSGR